MALTAEQRAIADKLLECLILGADGQAYEDIFTRTMTAASAGFRPVKPQGSIGDRKNDGYMSADGVFYQVYAPEDLGRNVTQALAKLTSDFTGLVKNWSKICPVRGFHYVLNDKFKGAYPTVEAALLKLKRKHKLEECAPFLAKDLMRHFRSLDERKMISIVGFIPSAESIATLDYLVFSDVLRHIAENPEIVTPEAILRVPDFSEKIALNDISAPVAGLLQAGNLQSGAVESFFGSHTGFSKEAVRDLLAKLYAKVKSEVEQALPQANYRRGDLIFFGLLSGVTPHNSSKAAQDAALVLLGYFFETCDIYEDPLLV